ncbi:MAG: SCO family protein [Bacteroidota bacterium]
MQAHSAKNSTRLKAPSQLRRQWSASLALLVAFFLLGNLAGCDPTPAESSNPPKRDTLPVMNQKPLPAFSFMNQDSQMVSEKEVMGRVHVADFFFTSCPTICPRMKANMLTVYEEFQSEDRILLVSHSIDTRHDSVPVLKAYAEKLEVAAPRWNFVTGEKEHILGMAKHYMIAAMEDSTAPGGYAHSGAMILFDGERNIRGYYDGTSAEETKELIRDMHRLLQESSPTP